MRLGQLTRMKVGPVVLLVKFSDNDSKKIMRDAAELPSEETPENAKLNLDWREGVVLKYTHSVVGGLEDDKGEPVKKLTKETLGEMPPGWQSLYMDKLANIGSDPEDYVVDEPAPVPPTAPAEPAAE